MKLSEKTVKIKGYEFQVREISMTEYMPILESLEEGSDIQYELFKACVSEEGEPIDYDKITPGVYMKLIPVVMELNDFATEVEGKGDSGND